MLAAWRCRHSSSTPCDMSQMWTRAPAPANVEAIALPMPAAPAVTSTRCPGLIANRSGVGMPFLRSSGLAVAESQNGAEHDEPEDDVAHRMGQGGAGEQRLQRRRSSTPPIMPR